MRRRNYAAVERPDRFEATATNGRWAPGRRFEPGNTRRTRRTSSRGRRLTRRRLTLTVGFRRDVVETPLRRGAARRRRPVRVSRAREQQGPRRDLPAGSGEARAPLRRRRRRARAASPIRTPCAATTRRRLLASVCRSRRSRPDLGTSRSRRPRATSRNSATAPARSATCLTATTKAQHRQRRV